MLGSCCTHFLEHVKRQLFFVFLPEGEGASGPTLSFSWIVPSWEGEMGLCFMLKGFIVK